MAHLTFQVKNSATHEMGIVESYHILNFNCTLCIRSQGRHEPPHKDLAFPAFVGLK